MKADPVLTKRHTLTMKLSIVMGLKEILQTPSSRATTNTIKVKIF